MNVVNLKEERMKRCKKHLPAFDHKAARSLHANEVRRRWPRFEGKCSACGFSGIAYASYEHYLSGDW